MVYRFLYYVVNLLLRIFYRKVYINGLDEIPKHKPLLIVSNHPNGFFEPIIMACLFPIDLHFLVRGDLFENKALRWLLFSTHQVPIYRQRDGIAALRNNQKTIDKTIEILKQNMAILIFAEGSTNGDWHVRELKKGMSRMAFQCLDGSPDLDLHILPVGITFQKSESPGTDVILNAGKPFSVKDFYVKNVREAKEKMEELNAFTRERVAELTLNLDKVEDEKFLRERWKEKIIVNYSSFFPRVIKSNALFQSLKQDELKLNNGESIVVEKKKYSSFLHYLTFPFALIGFFFWFLPVFIGNMITKKLVKQREFVSSIYAASSAVLCLLYAISFLVVASIYTDFLKASLMLVFLLFCGGITLYFWEREKLKGY